METLKVILHTTGDDKCLKNVLNYVIVKESILKKVFGINPDNPNAALLQFKKAADFFDNQCYTPIFHYITSYTKKTAPTAEKAMELTKALFEPLTQFHLAVEVVHFKERDGSSYHSHTAVSPTNIHNVSMLYGDNRTNYALAQRLSNITGEPVKLIIKSENGKEWECPRIFTPQINDK